MVAHQPKETETERPDALFDLVKKVLAVPYEDLPPISEKLKRVIARLAMERRLTREEMDRPCTI